MRNRHRVVIVAVLGAVCALIGVLLLARNYEGKFEAKVDSRQGIEVKAAVKPKLATKANDDTKEFIEQLEAANERLKREAFLQNIRRCREQYQSRDTGTCIYQTEANGGCPPPECRVLRKDGLPE